MKQEKQIQQFLKNNPTITKEQLIYRADGRIEWQCPHGIGHTIIVPKQYEKEQSWWIHGCCHEMCCSKLKITKKGG